MNKAFITSGDTVHIMKDVSMITRTAVPSSDEIKTAGSDTIDATAQNESVIAYPCEKKQVNLNRVLHVVVI